MWGRESIKLIYGAQTKRDEPDGKGDWGMHEKVPPEKGKSMFGSTNGFRLTNGSLSLKVDTLRGRRPTMIIS